MIKKGMRRQIVLHYIFVVFVALLLVEVIFLLAIRTYYYDSVYSKITTHIGTAEDFLKYEISGERSPNQLQKLLDFFEMDYTELQVLTQDGNMLISSTGFQPDRTMTTRAFSYTHL
ncbi:histidine kinase, partial [Paenibacillus riograndensis]